MKWLNYHHLIYFRSIATEGSIARAAEKLLVGQPALSAQLKRFESDLGHPLFERRKKRLVLTDAGKIVLKYAQSIHDSGQELLEALSNKTFSSTPILKIGALDGVPKRIVIDLVHAAHDLSSCTVTLVEGGPEQLLRAVHAHTLDLVVSDNPPAVTHDEAIFGRSLDKQAISIYGNPSFKECQKTFPQSLQDIPLIVPTFHSRLRHQVDSFFHINGLKYRMVAEVQDTILQKFLALEGLGAIPAADFSVREYVRSGQLVYLGSLPGVFEEYWLVGAKRVIENPLANALIKNFVIHSGENGATKRPTRKKPSPPELNFRDKTLDVEYRHKDDREFDNSRPRS